MAIEYSQPLKPALSPQDQVWVTETLSQG
ncbi:hypothetical protein [Phormidesmis priestleyi]